MFKLCILLFFFSPAYANEYYDWVEKKMKDHFKDEFKPDVKLGKITFVDNWKEVEEAKDLDHGSSLKNGQLLGIIFHTPQDFCCQE